MALVYPTPPPPVLSAAFSRRHAVDTQRSGAHSAVYLSDPDDTVSLYDGRAPIGSTRRPPPSQGDAWTPRLLQERCG